MAVFFSCDCCGVTGDKFDARGIVIKKFYCPECLVTVDNFFKARDELHTKLAKAFDIEVASLKASWYAIHPAGKLPDDK